MTADYLTDDEHEALVAELRDSGTGLLDLLDEARAAMLDAVPEGVLVNPRPLQEAVLAAWLEATFGVVSRPGHGSEGGAE